jgi:hypothetical protein
MKKFVLGALGFLVMGLIFTAVASEEEGLKEGKWTMTMVTKMEGLPPEAAAAMAQAGAPGMTTTVTQCITHENAIPNTKMPPECEQTVQRNGNTFNYHITCNKPDNQMEQTGEVTYSGDTMQGLVKSHQTNAGSSMDMTIQISGQYIGPCS